MKLITWPIALLVVLVMTLLSVLHCLFHFKDADILADNSGIKLRDLLRDIVEFFD